MDDKQIIKRLFDRAESALEALRARFDRPLHRIAVNILGSGEDAEECVNDTYLALWNAIPPAEPDPLPPYVYRTGRNIALKRLRYDRASRRNTAYDLSLEELEAVLPADSPDTALDARELGRAMNRFLSTESRDAREIFLCRYWFGDSVKAIARRMNRTENNVSVTLSRVKHRLKDHLIKEGFYYEA